MGVFSFVHELKTNVSPKRLFKALITHNHEVLPKVSPTIKSVETVQGDGGVGSIKKTVFSDDSPIKILKNRVDFIDTENCVSKFTLIEGDALDDKVEKICYELKFEDSKDGGCVLKIKSDYHTKGGAVLKEEDVKAGQDHAIELYKACADYLVANPRVCA
ncbi:major allergen Pru ar 1-like [Abeliophyllum distichum]|uniref:Major allergen Pru ar 1-like n=1 Tax=Abeliophyllum distichum TaxID=126358 RepID=A0ABD1Q0A8_9LAMI